MTLSEQNRRAGLGGLLLVANLVTIWLVALLAGGFGSWWDQAALSAAYQRERDTLVEIAWMVTWLGDWLVLVPVAMAAAGLMLWRGLRTRAVALVATVATVRILVSLQKVWFDRARPSVEQWMIETSNSFPSAHAANSFATYVAIAILLSGSRTAIGLATALSFVVGISRIVLGAHWPSDVIGGWAFAALAVLPLWRLRNRP